MHTYLHSLVIENFKSYHGKHEFGPFSSFTAVIGPNGCGKSNLLDAICFAFGDTALQLRAKRFDELVYGNVIGKSRGQRCSVTLVFNCGTEENGKADTEGCSRANGARVFTRSVRLREAHSVLDGSVKLVGDNVFTMDGQVVSNEAYTHELFRLTGVRPRSRSFVVAQGSVENIAMQDRRERAAVFDSISRASDLREAYESMKRAYEAATDELRDVTATRRDVELERQAVKIARENGAVLQQIERRMADKQTQLALFRLFHAEKQFKRVEQVCEELTTLLVEQSDELTQHETAAQRIEASRQVKQAQLSELDARLRVLTDEIAEARRFEAKCDTKRNHAEAAFVKLDTLYKRAELQVIEQRDCVIDLGRQVIATNSQLATLDQAVSALDESAARTTEEEYRDLRDRLVREHGRVFDDAALARANVHARVERGEAAVQRRDDLKRQICRKRDAVEQLESRKQRIIDVVETTSHAAEASRGRILELKSSVRTNRQQAEQLQSEYASLDERVHDFETSQAANQQAKKRRETLRRLQSVFGGVRGRLLELVEVTHERYRLALLRLIGMRQLESIVVDSTQTASRCIQFLREQRLAAETFLPLDSLAVKAIREEFRSLGEKGHREVILAFDVLRCGDPEVKKAAQFVCANALICNSIEDARYFAYRYNATPLSTAESRNKTVTLDGLKFGKDGTVTGGKHELERGERRWRCEEIEKIRCERDSCGTRLAQLSKQNAKDDVELHSLVTELARLEKQLEFASSNLKESEAECNEANTQLSSFTKEFEEAESECERIKNEIKSMQSAVKQAEDTLAIAEADVFRDFCSRHALNSVEEYETGELRTLNEHKQQKIAVQAQAARFTNQLSFEELRLAESEERIVSLRESLNAHKRERDEAQKKLKSAMGKRELLEEDKRDIEKQIKSHKCEVDEKSKAIEQARRSAREWKRNVDALEIRIVQAKRENYTAQLTRHTVLVDCKVRGLDLPFKRGGWESVCAITSNNETPSSATSSAPSNTNTSPAENDTQKIYVRELKEVQLDFSRLPTILKNLTEQCADRRIDESGDRDTQVVAEMPRFFAQRESAIQKSFCRVEKELQSKIDELQEQLDAASHYGTPGASDAALNMREAALDERRCNLERQLAAAHDKVREKQELFENVRRERIDRFRAMFDHVATCVDATYKALYGDNSASARLDLINEEEPYLDGIEFGCIVPTKRYRPIEMLSGGEKTLAAIALLFSILSYQPLPLVMLDEVDAALDSQNVRKLARFLVEHTQSNAATSSIATNFIVVTHKRGMYSRAQSLLGVYAAQPNADAGLQTGAVMLDLAAYRK